MDNSHRPDPDALLAGLLREEAQEKLGRLFIFLGMCPGVGKTYAMLKAARQRVDEGINVVAGVVETHGRKETAALLDSLTILPLRKMDYRGHVLEEFDLDAALRLAPSILLVDELAHTNVAGSRHPKRYQDVLELIAAGIDVYTTLNVQHIESQLDTVRQITGVTISETVPDSILDQAQEIQLVDLSVPQLLERLKEGKVYAGERAVMAAEGFFKEANLTTLRELALRFTAERVDRDLEEIRRSRRVSSPWKTSARLMVGVGPSPYSESLVRWTRRAAARLGCSWLVVWVEGSHALPPEDQERLAVTLGVARRLGAEVVSVTGEQIGAALLQVARERNVTQLVVGKPGKFTWWRSSLADILIRDSGDIDVCVVRPLLSGAPAKPGKKPVMTVQDTVVAEYSAAMAIIFVMVSVAWGALPWIGYTAVGLLFLLGIILASLRMSRGPVMLMAGAAALSWDYFFIEPRFTFHIDQLPDIIMFVMFFIVALSMGHLTTRLRQREKAERQRQRQTAALLRVTQSAALSAEPEKGQAEALSTINELLNASTALVIRRLDRSLPETVHRASTLVPTVKEWGVIHWTYNYKKAAGRFTDTLPESAATWFPLQTATSLVGVFGVQLRDGAGMDFGTRQAIEAFALQLALVLEKEHFIQAVKHAELMAQSEQLQRTLLDSVSHELKTPLAVIQASLEGMQEIRNPYLDEIQTASKRLQRVVNNLLQMTRIEAAAVRPVSEWCLLSDIVQQAVKVASDALSGRPCHVSIPADLPAVKLDPGLCIQAVANILHNAAAYTPAGTGIDISGSLRDGRLVTLSIADRGPGLKEGDEARVFEKFYRSAGSPAGGTGLGLSIARAFIRSLNGDIEARNRSGGGAEFLITIPVETLSK